MALHPITCPLNLYNAARYIITPYNLHDFENKLAVPLPRTNYYKNSFSYNGAIL